MYLLSQRLLHRNQQRAVFIEEDGSLVNDGLKPTKDHERRDARMDEEHVEEERVNRCVL